MAVSSHGEIEERVLWGPFHKGTNSIHEVSTLMTCSSFKGLHPLIPTYWRLGLKINLGQKDINIQSTANTKSSLKKETQKVTTIYQIVEKFVVLLCIFSFLLIYL